MHWSGRLTLAIAIAFSVAIFLYAYRSWPGFLTIAAIAGGLIIGLSTVAAIAARLVHRPARFDLVLSVAIIGILALSWDHIRATGDANRLMAELDGAGDDEVGDIVAMSSTDAGTLVAAIVARRNETGRQLQPLFAGLWDETILAIAAGPEAENPDRLAEAMAIADNLLAGIDAARSAVEASFEALLSELAALASPLPSSKRQSVLVAAQRQVLDQQRALLDAIDLAEARLEAGRRAASILSTFPLNYRFNRAEGVIELDQEGARIAETTRQYHRAVDDARDAGPEIEALLVRGADVGAEDIRALAEAATVPP